MKKNNTSLWQQEFAKSLFSGLTPYMAEHLGRFSEEEQGQRFAVYQNNTFYSLTNALADLYPAIKTLVGDVFFKQTAYAYIQSQQASDAAMFCYGWDFVNFLSDFEHTQDMQYLKAVAKLELARHKAYHAADDTILEREYFSDIHASEFEQSKLRYHSSFHLVESTFPIFTLWQNNHQQECKQNNDSEKPINLNEPEWVIIVRYHYEIQVFNVDRGTFLFHQYLSNGTSIIEAAHKAHSLAPDTDISSAIALGITNGFFTSITV